MGKIHQNVSGRPVSGRSGDVRCHWPCLGAPSPCPAGLAEPESQGWRWAVLGAHADAPLPPVPRPAQLNKAFQAEESPGVIYCISMQWFREWEAFVKGKDNGEWSRGSARAPGRALPARRARGLRGCWECPGRRRGPRALCLCSRFLVPPPSAAAPHASRGGRCPSSRPHAGPGRVLCPFPPVFSGGARGGCCPSCQALPCGNSVALNSRS